MTEHIAAVRQFYAAINRHDLQAVTRHLDPQIVRVEPAGFPTAGTYRGIAAVQAHIARGRRTWAEGACEPEQCFVQGDKVVAYLYVRVRLNDTPEWVEGRFADGFFFRAGRIVEFRSFGKRADALAWAGINAPAAAGDTRSGASR